jgi:hypothetical protein
MSNSRELWRCPSRAWMQERRSDADRSLVEPGVHVTWHTIAPQYFHGLTASVLPAAMAGVTGCPCLGDPAP